MSELMSVGPRNGIAAVSNKVAHVDVNVEEGHNSLPVDNGKSGSGNASKKKESHKSQKKDRLDSFISLAMLLKAKMKEVKRVVKMQKLDSTTSGMIEMWDFDKHRVETAKIMHTSLQQPEEDFGPDDGAGGGRWMHIYGSDKDTLNKLAAFYHIEDEDVEAAVNPANSGPEVNFRPGATEEFDYLMVIAHELRLERAEGLDLMSPRLTHNGQTMSRNQVAKNQVFDASSQLQLEEVQVVFFLFPAKRLLITLGANSEESDILQIARKNLMNSRSKLRKDCRTPNGGGLTTLVVVMLDAMLDAVFPILDLHGNALEGLQLLNCKNPAKGHVVLAQKLKTKVTQIRRYAWDAKGLVTELYQDMNGCLNEVTAARFTGLIESTKQMEKEAQSYMDHCVSIDSFFQAFQQTWMSGSLYVVSSATICFLPFQCLTGLWGMNFQGEDGLAMPELHWQYGYVMFWCIAGTCLLLGLWYVYHAAQFGRGTGVILLGDGDSDDDEIDNRVMRVTSTEPKRKSEIRRNPSGLEISPLRGAPVSSEGFQAKSPARMQPASESHFVD